MTNPLTDKHYFPEGAKVCAFCCISKGREGNTTCILHESPTGTTSAPRVSAVYDPDIGVRRRELFGKNIFEIAAEKDE